MIKVHALASFPANVARPICETWNNFLELRPSDEPIAVIAPCVPDPLRPLLEKFDTLSSFEKVFRALPLSLQLLEILIADSLRNLVGVFFSIPPLVLDELILVVGVVFSLRCIRSFFPV